MYKSKEIRWFKDSLDNSILDWFSTQAQTFENTDARTDYYLLLSKEDVTVKLRDRNIEIKHRLGERVKGKLTSTAEGYFEDWIKWSFNVDQDDKIKQQIVKKNLFHWIEAKKTRIGVKATKDAEGKIKVVSIKDFVNYGCQMEYTQLVVEQITYYTFAMEWFGEKYLEMDIDLISTIIGSTQMQVNDSCGYGAFLINR